MQSPKQDKYSSDRRARRIYSTHSSWSYQAADSILRSMKDLFHGTIKHGRKHIGRLRWLKRKHVSHNVYNDQVWGFSSEHQDWPTSVCRPLWLFRGSSKKLHQKFSFKKYILWSILVAVFISIVGFLGVYAFLIAPLPDIKTIEDKKLAEASVIYDKNGGELYKFGNEKRTYVPISAISQPIKDAIVSIEDKTFYENEWIDFLGLARVVTNAIGNRLFGLNLPTWWASTISQQLIKNMLLTSEKKLSRKIREAWLSYNLNQNYSKDQILELYLNKISFGHNAFGIEEASKTYFGKSAKDVGVFGASILASLPKWPTLYSPFSNRDRVVGYPFLYPSTSVSSATASSDFPEWKINSADRIKVFQSDLVLLKKFFNGITVQSENNANVTLCNIDEKNFIDSSLASVDNGCMTIARSQFFSFLTKVRLDALYMGSWENPSGKYFLEYYPGRKDSVIARMYEDQKITFEQARDAVVAWFDYQFVRRAENIRAPHFVFYVKEYLESNFGKDFDIESGIKIYTTLDPDFQEKAESLVKAQVEKNKLRSATSAALVAIDNSNGGILSMVGSHDYWDTEWNGQVNVITSRRQPGSTFKPFSYAYAMSKLPVSPDTPIYDVNTDFGNWSPDNYDGKFMGRMSLRTALDHSRNIPAIKMFLYAGGQEAITKFIRSIGIDSIKDGTSYWSSLALGAGEVKPLEMAQAYSVFANGGWYREVTPLVKIEDVSGNIIYETSQDNSKKATLTFSEGASYLISNILSDTTARPSTWNTYLTLKWRPVAAKTGTSNKEITKTKILPRDLWTVGYTPQITTAVWAWNLNGKETAGTCDGLNCAGPIWRDYMNYAHEKLPVKNFERPKEGIYEVAISKISGKIAGENTPKSLTINALFAVKPQQADAGNQMVEYDTLCNGLATDATPEWSRRRGMILAVEPIIESSQVAWKKGIAMNWSSIEGVGEDVDILTDYKDTPCERPNEWTQLLKLSGELPSGSIGFGRYPIILNYEAQAFARKIVLSLDSQIVTTYDITGNQSKWSVTLTPSFDNESKWQHVLRAVLYDRFGYASTLESNIVISRGGELAPIPVSTGATASGATSSSSGIKITSPLLWEATIKSWQPAIVHFEVAGTAADTIKVSVDGGLDARSFQANQEKYQTVFYNLSPGDHIVTIEAWSLRRDVIYHVR
jgi:penicillin-binding protein 1A